MSDFPYRRFPCARSRTDSGCPFRRDTEPGEFPACRYEALERTVGSDDAPVMPWEPIFACHKTDDGREETCAGWLAVCGHHHLAVRIAVIKGDLPPEALRPGDGWPELFGSYAEMAEQQGRP